MKKLVPAALLLTFLAGCFYPAPQTMSAGRPMSAEGNEAGEMGGIGR